MNVKLISLINLGTMPWPLFGEALTQAWIRICRPVGFCWTFSHPLWVLWIKMLKPDTNIPYKYNYGEVLVLLYLLCAFPRLRKRTINLVMLSVRPSVHMEQLHSYWTCFHIDIGWFFQKSVERIQVSLKHDKNKGYFTWRPSYIYKHISLSSSNNEKFFWQKM